MKTLSVLSHRTFLQSLAALSVDMAIELSPQPRGLIWCNIDATFGEDIRRVFAEHNQITLRGFPRVPLAQR